MSWRFSVTVESIKLIDRRELHKQHRSISIGWLYLFTFMIPYNSVFGYYDHMCIVAN